MADDVTDPEAPADEAAAETPVDETPDADVAADAPEPAIDDEPTPAADAGAKADAEKTPATKKATADKVAAKPASTVVRKKVTSKRVTPKGGPVAAAKGTGKGATKGSTAARAHAADGDDASFSTRYTPPTAKYEKGPSPWWVPALMFGLIGVGALLIMLNYAQVFGDPDNIRLVVGLGLILGGIVTATQYR